MKWVLVERTPSSVDSFSDTKPATLCRLGPLTKMSRSYDNTIEIFAEGKPLEKRVMSIKTDSTPMGEPLNPDGDTVYALYRLFAS